MHTIEINKLPDIIDVCPDCINLMFIGDTGIGKTTIIEKYCEEKGIYLKTLILSQLEASETLGIPVLGKREYNGKTFNCLDTAIPSWVFDLAEHDKAILFLDEFLCTQPSVMNAFLNFLTSKKVGDIDLSHVKVISATNIGNYTFEPDNNILSRFCMFYVINTTYNNYIKNKNIDNDYIDNSIKEGIIFEERSLKPRCQEQLSYIDTFYLPWFYEGFTNKELASFHPNQQINSIIKSFARRNEESIYMPKEFYASMSQILIKNFPKIQDWSNRVSQIHDIEIDKDKLLKMLNKGSHK